MRTLAVYNVKGGVGKTTTAVNLAYLSAREGRRTLLWDLDPQAAATYLFRVKPRVRGGSGKLVRRKRPLDDAIKGTDFDRLDLLPADFTYRNMDLDLADTSQPSNRLRRLLAPLADEYDLVVLDTPPSVSLVSENVLDAADLVLVPVIPTVLAVRTFEQLTAFVDELARDGHRPHIHAFFSMVDRRKSLHRGLVDRLSKERDDVGAVAVPALSVVERMTLTRAPLPAFAPTSTAARAFERLWTEVAPLLDAAD
ncbi:MAG: AAA family ATPase [Streptosporangiales bacterium]|nr:AAA family ATPase [Streptosporangiales bacterium]